MAVTIFNVEYENNMRGRKRRLGEGKKRSKMSMDAVFIPWAADVFPF